MPVIVYVPLVQEAPITAPKHLVTRQWVEDLLSGKIKAPAEVVATVNQVGTHTHAPPHTGAHECEYTAHEELEIDGVHLQVGDRVLFVAQDDGEENGLWEVTDHGADPTPGPGHGAHLKRPDDFDEDNKI